MRRSKWYVHNIKVKFKIYRVRRVKLTNLGTEKDSERDKKIIVSLTSYNKRFSTLDLCIKTLLMQTLKPDKIILYLMKADRHFLPKNVLDLQNYGLEIRYVEQDLRPHKKYYYAMKEFPDDIIITTDDDCLYSKHLIEGLYRTYQKFPMAITAGRARNIKIKDNKFLPYDSWDLAHTSSVPSLKLLATGVGGVLYPPYILDTFLLLNIDKIMDYMPVDDLWLKAVELINGVPTVLCNLYVDRSRIELPGTAEVGLAKSNVEENQNDKYWSLLNKEFKLIEKLGKEV